MNKKVMTKAWIPAEYDLVPGGRKVKPGTGCYSKYFTEPGEYLGITRSYEEIHDGNDRKLVAPYDRLLIIKQDGTVQDYHPSDVKFVDNKTVLAISKLIGIFIITVVVVFAWEFGKALLQNINR